MAGIIIILGSPLPFRCHHAIIAKCMRCLRWKTSVPHGSCNWRTKWFHRTISCDCNVLPISLLRETLFRLTLSTASLHQGTVIFCTTPLGPLQRTQLPNIAIITSSHPEIPQANLRHSLHFGGVHDRKRHHIFAHEPTN